MWILHKEMPRGFTVSCVEYCSRDFQIFLDDTRNDERKYVEINDIYATAVSYPSRGPVRRIKLRLESTSQLRLLALCGFRRVQKILARM